MKTPVDYAQQAVTDLERAIEQLAGCLQQGVARPWKAPSLTVERRNQLDQEARAEFLERDDLAPGESPAPLDLDVMDELVEILAAAEVLAARVCAATGHPAPPPARSAFADPRPHLELIRRLLPEAFVSQDRQLVAFVQYRAVELLERAHETLGLVSDGQVLKTLCPWCHGRSPTAPNGGEHTLRVRNIKGMDTPLVICEGGQCEPPEKDCGIWVLGHPAWQQHEWDWLAQRLTHADRQRETETTA